MCYYISRASAFVSRTLLGNLRLNDKHRKDCIMKYTLKNVFGDKAFNKLVLAIALPIVIQNGITNFVNLLDNIMIGQVGIEEMNGVSIVNQLMFVFNLCIFGAVSGAGIFTAQYYGRGDADNMRYTVRYKLYSAVFAVIFFAGILLIFHRPLIDLYITPDESGTDPVATAERAKEYLFIAIYQLPFFAVSQVYAGTLRESNETKVPMYASLASFLCNFAGNSLLIFGLLGLPALGVKGAAIATVLARAVEATILVVYAHKNTDKHPAFKGLYSSFKVPSSLAKNITKKGMPILINETLWAIGVALLTQCYSLRGLPVLNAYSIASTITNLFAVVLLALGNAVAIILGNYLGAGKTEEAVVANVRLVSISVASSIIIGAILASLSGVFPQFYNTTDEIKSLASSFIFIFALYMPVNSYINCTYFTLRSGGKTIITFLFDSVFECCLAVPVAYLLVTLTELSAPVIYAIVLGLWFVKVIAGVILIGKRIWLNDLTSLDS